MRVCLSVVATYVVLYYPNNAHLKKVFTPVVFFSLSMCLRRVDYGPEREMRVGRREIEHAAGEAAVAVGHG